MRLLLDTQCFLWMTAAPGRFRPPAWQLLHSPATILYLSAASAWELAIKCGLGKIVLPETPAVYVEDRVRRTRATPLPISLTHALRVADLPRHHRDPFDRLLVAQAQIEKLAILTADRQLAVYDVEIVEA
jgi:PIN domain nuclease of toxin-antitoxin system